MIGRKEQVGILQDALKKGRSSFIAITGRRRVGKTYLIDEVYRDNICLRVTGIQDGDLSTQIINFVHKIAEYSKKPIVTTPNDWQEVMILLKEYLKELSKRKKQVIFIDELPWIATKRSQFVQHLAHLWNDYLSKEKHFVLVICGSATSWITQKIVNDKGGFHNRLTHQIHLKPFTLSEVEAYLKSKGIRYSRQAITELYMCIGGIPYYLDYIKKGDSVSQAVAKMCFSEDGVLKYEFDNLYKAIFEQPENHEAIVKALAMSPQGLTRKEIIEKSKVKAGGPYTRAMNDLISSGFIEEILPFNKKKRGAVYRLMDEYTKFYFKFIQPNIKKKSNVWQSISQSQTYKIWSGYAFEMLCHKHIDKIMEALGIAGINAETYSYHQNETDEQYGYQIDLIIDRTDQVVNLCECKYYQSEYIITKKEAKHIRERSAAFKRDVVKRKTVFNTWITTYGVKQNDLYHDLVDIELTIEDLF